MIKIYTDGSCLKNPGDGGWAAVIIRNDESKEISGSERNTTNNRMELLAVIIALENIKKPDCQITVYSDSKYVVDAVEKKWVFSWEKKNFKNKKNPDLWIRFLKIFTTLSVRFIWVKGHSDNVENERCDFLAVEATEQASLEIDAWYEKNIKKEPPSLF